MATLASAKNKYVSNSVQTMSPGRMIVALYDRMLLDLDRAESAIAAVDIEGAHSALLHAQEIIDELYTSLDVKEWAAGRGLAALYRWMKDELVDANVAKDAAPVRRCRELLLPLRDAWREAAGIIVNAEPAAP
jgi:flagellar secretion chaperone FliS